MRSTCRLRTAPFDAETASGAAPRRALRVCVKVFRAPHCPRPSPKPGVAGATARHGVPLAGVLAASDHTPLSSTYHRTLSKALPRQQAPSQRTGCEPCLHLRGERLPSPSGHQDHEIAGRKPHCSATRRNHIPLRGVANARPIPCGEWLDAVALAASERVRVQRLLRHCAAAVGAAWAAQARREQGSPVGERPAGPCAAEDQAVAGGPPRRDRRGR